MRNILTFLSFTLLFISSNIVFSEHDSMSNNGGHSEWGRSSSSNVLVSKKYTDYWYRIANDVDDPMYADTSVDTILDNIPALFKSSMSWKCDAEVRCKSNNYKGTCNVYAAIIVDGETKDIDYGALTTGYVKSFEGKYKDRAKANHNETKTRQGSYPHPSITALDCRASGTIGGKPYNSDLTAYKSAWSVIPWDDNGDDDGSADGSGEGGTTGESDGGTTTYLADSSTRTLTPASGSYTYATVGSTHEASLTSSIDYDSVVWQVGPPNHIGSTYPTVETDIGDGTLTDASLSYTFPTDVPGTYTIIAIVSYSDLSARQLSYDVTVTLSPGLRPINGSSYYANGGDTYEMGLVTDAPYSEVRWSVKPPGDTSIDGIRVETDYTTDTTTEAEFSYTMPTGNSGSYRITAHVFRSDGTDYKVTYDVYIY